MSNLSEICRARSDEMISVISGSDAGVDAGDAGSSNPQTATATADLDPADTVTATATADTAMGYASRVSGDADNGAAVEASLEGTVSGTRDSLQ